MVASFAFGPVALALAAAAQHLAAVADPLALCTGGRFEMHAGAAGMATVRRPYGIDDRRMGKTMGIVIVDIDERSFAEAGRAGLSRDKKQPRPVVNRLFDQYQLPCSGSISCCRGRQQLWAAPQATGRGRAGRRPGVSSATGRAGSPA